MKVFLVLFILLFTFTTSFSFIVQTSPPPVLRGFACDCTQIVSCQCRLGDVTVTVLLRTEEWQKFADRSLLGGKICAAKCIASIGEVVRVSAPFLSVQTLERVEKAASLAKKKTIARNEKGAGSVMPGGSGVTTGYSVEESRGITREKSLSVMKAKAKSQNVDLTTYFVLKYTEFRKGKAGVEEVFEVLEEMIRANVEGRLEQYLASFWQ